MNPQINCGTSWIRTYVGPSIKLCLYDVRDILVLQQCYEPLYDAQVGEE